MKAVAILQRMSEQTNVHSAEARFEDVPGEIAALLTSAIVSDSLDASGVRGQVMTARIAPLTSGSRAVGRARTVRFAPSDVDSDDPYGSAMSFIDTLTPGSVAVVATGEDERTAYWGELFSAAAVGHGAVGTVCDGPVRDVAKVRAVGYDLFAPSFRPLDFRARMQVVSVGEPVECGGVPVAPDDLVLADEDGVVVVPQALEAEVLRRAIERATAERSVLEELLGGASLREVWERWHVL
jgi:4-hydroxy-4-methyl-2-oxoglutarate aldolase